MTTNKQESHRQSFLPDPVPHGRALFLEQAVTLGTSGSEVTIQCDTVEEAEEVLTYLESLSEPETK